MKVLHVIPSVAPVRGGPSQAVVEAVHALNALGVDAEIASTDDDGARTLDVPLRQRIVFAGAPVRFFPRWSPPLRALRDFAYSGPLAGWLAQHLTDYDLLHVHALFSFAPSLAMTLARRRGVPYIVRPLGLLGRWSLQQSRLRKQAFLAAFDRANLDGARGIEFTAGEERDEAADLGLRAPGFVLPFGINLPTPLADARERVRQRLRLPPDEPIILFLSRVHPKKGLEPLIEALETMANRRFSLVIAGSGEPEYERRIQERVQGGSLAQRTRFAGFVQGEVKQELLQGADVFALTSHSESFGIAVVEALAAGTPVVITPGVPLAGVVRASGAGWVCDLASPAIAQSVAAALDGLSDSAIVAERARRCRALAQQFMWSTLAVRLREVYAAVLAGRPPPTFPFEAVGSLPDAR
jgi:glycosyltransferase involved in cell wall biosynthesis